MSKKKWYIELDMLKFFKASKGGVLKNLVNDVRAIAQDKNYEVILRFNYGDASSNVNQGSDTHHIIFPSNQAQIREYEDRPSLPLSSMRKFNLYQELVASFQELDFGAVQLGESSITGISILRLSTIVFNTLAPISDHITDVSILGRGLSNPDSEVAQILAMVTKAYYKELENLSVSLPYQDCDKVIEVLGFDYISQNVKHLYINRLEVEGSEDIGNYEFIQSFSTASSWQEGPENYKLKTVEIVNDPTDQKLPYTYPATYEMFIGHIYGVAKGLEERGTKLSIKNANIVFDTFELEERAELPLFLDCVNTLNKFLNSLVDSNVHIGFKSSDYVWALAEQNPEAAMALSKMLNGINKSTDNTVALQGYSIINDNAAVKVDLNKCFEDVTGRISQVLDKAIHNDYLQDLVSGSSTIKPVREELFASLKQLQLTSDRAEVRGNYEVSASIEDFLAYNFWLINGILGNKEGITLGNKHLPYDALYNIASFLPNKLLIGHENNPEGDTEKSALTKEQMDAIWSKLKVGDKLHYLGAIDYVNDGVDKPEYMSKFIIDHINGSIVRPPLMLPLFINDPSWGERWVLYFQPSPEQVAGAVAYIIDPLMEFQENSYFEKYLIHKLAPEMVMRVSKVDIGVPVTTHNSGAWVLYIMEKLQSKFIDSIAPISIDCSWMHYEIAHAIACEFPDIESLLARYTQLYEGTREIEPDEEVNENPSSELEAELMDMVDEYYNELNLGNNTYHRQEDPGTLQLEMNHAVTCWQLS